MPACTKPANIVPLVPKTVEAQRIGVLDGSGSDFDILLKDGRRIRASLGHKTPKEAHDEVVRFINQSLAPKVVLYSEHEGVWLVDIRLLNKGKEVELSKWLHDKKLTWE